MSRVKLEDVLERSGQVLAGKQVPARSKSFSKYAISNFRGGIGKSTLTFNLAYEVTRDKSLLLLDTCSQKNTTQMIFGAQISDVQTDLNKALISEIVNTSKIPFEELCIMVNAYCSSFSGGKPLYLIPGSSELFLFPSLLYSQLAQYSQLTSQREEASSRILSAISRIIESAKSYANQDITIIDTSPFFGGATHLSWCASEALIIPVRVDQNSIEALHLTLEMLKNKTMDFHKFNAQANISQQPVIHAIAMTHCGWNRQIANTPDSTTKYFVQKAIEVAEQYSELFSEDDVSKCFYLLDDFHSAGRISGNQRIPISKLSAMDKFNVDGQRMAVNPSVDRYKLQIKNLANSL